MQSVPVYFFRGVTKNYGVLNLTGEGLQFEYQSDFLELRLFRSSVRRMLITFEQLAEIKVETEDIFWYILTLRFHSLTPNGVRKLKIREDATVHFNLSKKYLKTARHFVQGANEVLQAKAQKRIRDMQIYYPTELP